MKNTLIGGFNLKPENHNHCGGLLYIYQDK